MGRRLTRKRKEETTSTKTPGRLGKEERESQNAKLKEMPQTPWLYLIQKVKEGRGRRFANLSVCNGKGRKGGERDISDQTVKKEGARRKRNRQDLNQV